MAKTLKAKQVMQKKVILAVGFLAALTGLYLIYQSQASTFPVAPFEVDETATVSANGIITYDIVVAYHGTGNDPKLAKDVLDKVEVTIPLPTVDKPDVRIAFTEQTRANGRQSLLTPATWTCSNTQCTSLFDAFPGNTVRYTVQVQLVDDTLHANADPATLSHATKAKKLNYTKDLLKAVPEPYYDPVNASFTDTAYSETILVTCALNRVCTVSGVLPN